MRNYDNFIKSTVNPDEFTLYDVIPDGNCGFRACALNLYLYNINLLEHLNNDKHLKMIFEKNNSLKDFKKIEEDWDYCGKNLEQAGILLRKKTINYILKSWNNPISDNLLSVESYETLGEYVLGYHEISTKEDYEKQYLDNENDQSWIGNPEFYALTKLLNITVNVYVLIRFFKKEQTTQMVKLYKNGKIPINTRIRLFEVIGQDYSINEKSINLLFEYDKYGSHHYLFIKKNE